MNRLPLVTYNTLLQYSPPALNLASLKVFILWLCQFNESLVFFSREVAETSPYYEALKKDDVEVGLFMSTTEF